MIVLSTISGVMNGKAGDAVGLYGLLIGLCQGAAVQVQGLMIAAGTPCLRLQARYFTTRRDMVITALRCKTPENPFQNP